MLKETYADLFPDLSVGKPVPEIATKNVRGKDVKLSDLKGKVVVLAIWTTWCPHSRAGVQNQPSWAQYAGHWLALRLSMAASCSRPGD
jgi:thiol-disulfide isomerase/thioredoxin